MKTTRKQIYACKTLEELESLARRAGYSHAWVMFIYNARKIKQLKKGSK